jgi:hypothetical protein
MKFLYCRGTGERLRGSPDGAELNNQNVPEPKMERKYFVIFSRALW